MNSKLQRLNDAYSPTNIHFEIINEEIVAKGYTYENRHLLKENGFKWDPKVSNWKLSLDLFENEDFIIPIFEASQSIEVIREKILNYINQIQSSFLKNLVERIIKFGKHQHNYFCCPAAKQHHHAYCGGLAEHSLQVLEGALTMADNYSIISLNRDLLIASAILHDIGKVECFIFTSENIQITRKFIELDHIVVGIIIVSQAAVDLIENDFDRKIFDLLIQIITSLHESKELGSHKEIKCPEAWIMYTMDVLSSQIGGFAKIV